MYELRYKINKNNYEILGSYHTPSLAYGMRKKKSKLPQYPLCNLKVVKI